jgi:predicted RNase H-like HicB family nuclease
MEISGYIATIRQDGSWWIGWIDEVPGVNSLGNTRDELAGSARRSVEMNNDQPA